jgi:hypothetical protein
MFGARASGPAVSCRAVKAGTSRPEALPRFWAAWAAAPQFIAALAQSLLDRGQQRSRGFPELIPAGVYQGGPVWLCHYVRPYPPGVRRGRHSGRGWALIMLGRDLTWGRRLP